MNAIDLFAGAGGFTTGAQMAGHRVVWAANHWPEAVDVHRRNHPATDHECQDLQQADWSLVPAHDLLLASPACQGHSRARGKEQAHHDSRRSTAWAVVSAVEAHRPAFLVVENVPDFARWALFPVWRSALETLGYALTIIEVDAADCGVPQHRKRLFVVGVRGRQPVRLDLPRRPHVAAASIIDFGAGTWSSIARPGRSLATLARIAAGRAVHGERFLTPYYGSGSGLGGRSLHRPIGTITTLARWAVIDGDRMRMLSVDESRRAMGFPSNYRLPSNKRSATHMLGNAVPPPMARDVIAALQVAA